MRYIHFQEDWQRGLTQVACRLVVVCRSHERHILTLWSMSLHSRGALLLGQAGCGLLLLAVESQEVCQPGLQKAAEPQRP